MVLRMCIDLGVSTGEVGDFEVVRDTRLVGRAPPRKDSIMRQRSRDAGDGTRCVLGCNPKQADAKSSSATDRWNETQHELLWFCPTQPAASLVPAAGAGHSQVVNGLIAAFWR